MPFTGTYVTLASAYAASGRPDKGVDVLQEYLRNNPDNATAHTFLGHLLTTQGKLDEALTAYGKAAALAPGDRASENGRRGVHVLTGNWSEAEAADRKLQQSNDSTFRAIGGINLAIDALYRGRLGAALKQLEQTAAGEGPGGSTFSASARNLSASVLLETGNAALAVPAAERAFNDARTQGPEWQSLLLAARAHARIGHREEAQKHADELARRANLLPSDREKRRERALAGMLALDRGDTKGAVAALTQAEAMLTPHAVAGSNLLTSVHVPIWYALGSAHLVWPPATFPKRRFVTSGLSTPAEPGSILQLSSSAVCTIWGRSTIGRATATRRARSTGDSSSTGAMAKSIASGLRTHAKSSARRSTQRARRTQRRTPFAFAAFA